MQINGQWRFVPYSSHNKGEDSRVHDRLNPTVVRSKIDSRPQLFPHEVQYRGHYSMLPNLQDFLQRNVACNLRHPVGSSKTFSSA